MTSQAPLPPETLLYVSPVLPPAMQRGSWQFEQFGHVRHVECTRGGMRLKVRGCVWLCVCVWLCDCVCVCVCVMCACVRVC